MNVQAALKSQYHGALSMLKQAIEQCPDDLWTTEDHSVAFWRVAYHTLFFTHLYLQPNAEAFQPWEHARQEYQFLGPVPWPPHYQPKIGEPYTKCQILEYWQLCDAMIDAAVDRLNLAAADCGFPWYQIPKLDHQILNIRHTQHHTALLSGRLRLACKADIRWV